MSSNGRGAATAGRMSSRDDFVFVQEIGGGSWSTVLEATHALTGKKYAVKILSKAKLIKEKKVKSATAEKDALAKLSAGDHPGFLQLYSAFQDKDWLYFVMSFAPNGDLSDLVKTFGSLSTNCARNYTAQVVDAVQWMHSQGILHRDLKPENFVLDSTMHIKIVDFGTTYISPDKDLSSRPSTFVGTAAYVSPELLAREKKSTSTSSDIWAVGCILYFLLCGQSPFLALTDYLSFVKIQALDYTFPSGFDPEAQDLVRRILVLDPAERLGVGPKSSPVALREHSFFIGPHADSLESSVIRINWESLWIEAPVPPGRGLIEASTQDTHDDSWDTAFQAFSLEDR